MAADLGCYFDARQHEGFLSAGVGEESDRQERKCLFLPPTAFFLRCAFAMGGGGESNPLVPLLSCKSIPPPNFAVEKQ